MSDQARITLFSTSSCTCSSVAYWFIVCTYVTWDRHLDQMSITIYFLILPIIFLQSIRMYKKMQINWSITEDIFFNPTNVQVWVRVNWCGLSMTTVCITCSSGHPLFKLFGWHVVTLSIPSIAHSTVQLGESGFLWKWLNRVLNFEVRWS